MPKVGKKEYGYTKKGMAMRMPREKLRATIVVAAEANSPGSMGLPAGKTT